MTAQTTAPTTTELRPCYVPAAALRDALTAVLLSAEKPTGITYVLETVRMRKTGAELELVTTDRYRLTRAVVALVDDKRGGLGDDWEILLHRIEAKALRDSLPTHAKGGLNSISLTVVASRLGKLSLDVQDYNRTTTYSSAHDEVSYPKIDRSLDEPEVKPADARVLDGISFDPRYLADLCKMPGLSQTNPLRLQFYGQRQPVRATWESKGVTYLHVLMPVTPRADQS